MKKLLEVKRDELLSRAKNETPERYNRRMNYVTTIKPMKMAQDLFINTGTLTVPISVGDYVVTNPYNRGSVCKHITAALVRPSQWIKFVDTWITTITKAYLQNKLNISETDIEDEVENLDKEYADVIKDEIENIQNVDDSILDKVNNNVTVDFDEIPNEVEEETDEEVES